MTSLQLKQFEFKFLEKINYKLFNSSNDEYALWELNCYRSYGLFNTSLSACWPKLYQVPCVCGSDPRLLHYQHYKMDNGENYLDMCFLDNLSVDTNNDCCSSTDALLSPPSHVISKSDSTAVQDCQDTSNDVTATEINYLSVVNSQIENYLLDHYLQI
jgi:hypothetical protein